MTSRGQGDYLERQARLALESAGWWVIRAAGSHGIADLVAMRADRLPLLVSCKKGGTIPRQERHRLWLTAQATGARPVLATRDHPGWVAFYQLLSTDPRHHHLVDELKVPHRPGKADPDAVPDALPLHL
jgi:Holliday junction resolvase